MMVVTNQSGPVAITVRQLVCRRKLIKINSKGIDITDESGILKIIGYVYADILQQ
jgi:hypothetical protein